MDIITPIDDCVIDQLTVGDTIRISGYILCGRDAVLPRVITLIEECNISSIGVDLRGQIVFHTAVSPAGVGPTSSNKIEIENSIAPLSKAGVKIHLGKGALQHSTIAALEQYRSAYALIPPVTALLGARIKESKVIAFPELGMEALHLIKVEHFPAIIGAVHGRSIYE